MKVLSLFDGMGCAMLALLAQGVKVDKYIAYEIDKYAIQTASHNFPMIEQRGDVFEADFTEFKGFDYLMGGSPCTYWSIAQKNNRETEASGMGWELFRQYVRALEEAQPKYFIYENNKSMSKAIRESITDAFGFEPICINSALVSAQNRQRLYWVGKRNDDGSYSKVEIEQPTDRGILLKDVLEDGVVEKDKGYCLKHQAGNARDYFKKHHTNIKFEPVRIPQYGAEDKARPVCHSYSKQGCGQLDKNVFPTNPCKQLYDYICEPIRIPPYGNEDKSRPLNAYYPNNCGGFEHRMFSENPNKQQVDMVAEPVCVAQRGRYADTGKRSVKGNGPIEQYYEAREDGKTNVLTTVQKDNYVAEPIRVGSMPRPNGELSASQSGRVYGVVGKAINLTAGGGGAGAKTGLYAVPLKVGEVNGGGQGNRIYSVDGKAVSQTATSGGIGSNTGLYAIPVEFDGDKPIKAISCADGKTYQAYEVKNGLITIKGKEYPIKLADGFYIIRKLTVRECMRLQTVPEWYDFSVVSDTQAYKMLGNGWTVEVIAHLLNYTTK